SAPARRPRAAPGRGRPARRELRRLAALRRGARGRATAGPRLRGSALGRRRPTRLRRPPRRLGHRCPAAAARNGTSRAARPLDGLGGEEKRLRQDAAVLGKVVWAGGAAALSGFDDATVEQALHSLERKGLVRRERRSAVGGEEELAFRHVLVRDIAYGQIPRA